jgi:flagellar hook-associated protein 3 FlgL
MRVTQGMLAGNSLRHISQGYMRLGELQDQLSTGKRITRASQDPVVAMKGIRYRTQVAEVEQFKRNLREVYNWMDTADAALGEATDALARIHELATQAANDTYEETQRANIAKEIRQLYEHLQSIANTKNSGKYIFNGTNTTNPPIVAPERMDLGFAHLLEPGTDLQTVEIVYDGQTYHYVGENADGHLVFQDVRQMNSLPFDETDSDEFNEKAFQLVIDPDLGRITSSQPNVNTGAAETKNVRLNDVVVADREAVSFNTQRVEIELLKGVKIPVNTNPTNVFNNALFGDILRLEKALEDPSVSGAELTAYIDNFTKHIDQVTAERAELGARVNRVEMLESRILQQEITSKRIMSDNEDVDLEKVIIDLTIQESVHRAALAVGARIMQPTLMDFLR